MSSRSLNQRVKDANKLFETLQKTMSMREYLAWEEARMWYELQGTRDYKYIFGGTTDVSNERSWNAFLQEVGVPRSTVDMKIRLYQFWVLEKKMPIATLIQYPIRKLDRAITPIKEGKYDAVDVLDHARVLPLEQFILWLKGNEEPEWAKPNENVGRKPGGIKDESGVEEDGGDGVPELR